MLGRCRPTDPRRADLRTAATRAAEEFDGVLTMRRLRGLGYDHGAIAREVAALRWRRQGRHTVALHTGELSERALRWRAVWEVAERVAQLDGVSALHAAEADVMAQVRRGVAIDLGCG